jgi:hypothetical protein
MDILGLSSLKPTTYQGFFEKRIMPSNPLNTLEVNNALGS